MDTVPMTVKYPQKGDVFCCLINSSNDEPSIYNAQVIAVKDYNNEACIVTVILQLHHLCRHHSVYTDDSDWETKTLVLKSTDYRTKWGYNYIDIFNYLMNL